MAEDNSYDGVFCEQSASLYTIDFAGVSIETTVALNASAVEKWIGEASGTIFALEIGLCDNSPATLHLCAQNRCLIIQLRHLYYIPDSLKSFCNDEGNYFFGAGIDENVDSDLGKDCWLEFLKDVNVRLFSLEFEEYDCIMQKCKEQKDLVGALIGFYIMNTVNKAQRMDIGWEEEVLDIKLVKQATVKAYVSYIIGCNLVP